jgi:hypothetical protein
MIRVLIANGSSALLIALRRLFAGDSRFSIAGEAATYPETIALLLEIIPDILLR